MTVIQQDEDRAHSTANDDFPEGWYASRDHGTLFGPGGVVCACPQGTLWNLWLPNARAIARALSTPPTPTSGMTAIMAERRRQIDTKGWSPQHDDEHTGGELAGAAACYARNGTVYKVPEQKPKYRAVEEARKIGEQDMQMVREAVKLHNERNPSPPRGWPWELSWWKPSSRKRDIEKAGALLVAEWERLDRLEAHRSHQVKD